MSRLTKRHPNAQKLSIYNRSVLFNSQDAHLITGGLFADTIELQVISTQDRGAVNLSVPNVASDTNDARRSAPHHYVLSVPKFGLRTTIGYRFAGGGISDGDAKIMLPDGLMDTLHWQANDLLVVEKRTSNRWMIKNLSVRVLFVARARRNLKALAHALNDPLHPLERVIIIPRGSYRDPMVLTDISAAAFLYKDGRITEAEIRSILESAVRPAKRIKLGSLLAEIGGEAGGFDLEVERDRISTSLP